MSNLNSLFEKYKVRIALPIVMSAVAKLHLLGRAKQETYSGGLEDLSKAEGWALGEIRKLVVEYYASRQACGAPTDEEEVGEEAVESALDSLHSKLHKVVVAHKPPSKVDAEAATRDLACIEKWLEQVESEVADEDTGTLSL